MLYSGRLGLGALDIQHVINQFSVSFSSIFCQNILVDVF